MTRHLPIGLLLLSALALSAAVGCTRNIPKSAGAPSPATIAVDVKSEEWHIGELDKDLSGMLKNDLLKAGVGVPVVEGKPSDLTLVVKLTDTTFTTVVAYEWQLVDNATGRVVHAGDHRAIIGQEAPGMSETILADLVKVETASYASDKGAAPTGKKPPSDATASGLPTPPASTNEGGQSWAVVVGIADYRNDLTAATGAEEDAKAFAAYAHTTLGVPEKQIKILLGERATRADIRGAIEEWLPRNAVADGGRVYVYFSGHGAPDIETGDAYLVPWEADPAYLKTGGYPVSQLQSTLSSLEGQEVFVFLDACFSGTGGRSVLAEGTRPLVPVKPVEAAPQVFTLTAAGPGQATGVHADSGHGLFTHHLLNGLAGGADVDADKAVSLQELATYVADKVETEARRDNRDQKPTIATPAGARLEGISLVEGLK